MLLSICLIAVEKAEGHGKPTGERWKKRVATSFYGCKKPSITVIEHKYKLIEIYSHSGNSGGWGLIRQIPVHQHVRYTYGYENVKRGHPYYNASSCDTKKLECKDKRIETYLGSCGSSDNEEDSKCRNDIELYHGTPDSTSISWPSGDYEYWNITEKEECKQVRVP